MFDNLQRELRRLGRGVEIPVEIPLDEKGYLDRECPAVNCKIPFKVMYEDWRDAGSVAVRFCPICGKSAEPTDWNTEDQVEYLRREVQRHLVKSVGAAMKKDARRSKARSKPRGSFIQVSLSAKPGRIPVRIPIAAAEALRQDFVCEKCNCRYSTIGASYFCPACQHNSPISDFANSIGTINQTLDALPAICEAIRLKLDADAAKNTERQFLENAVEDLATLLQRTTGELFNLLPNESEFRRDDNMFQRLEPSSHLWKEAVGKGYEDIVGAANWKTLKQMMHWRHKLGHKLGMVDHRYVERSGDSAYQAGQRLVITEAEVREVARIVDELVSGLQSLLP